MSLFDIVIAAACLLGAVFLVIAAAYLGICAAGKLRGDE